MINIFFNGDSRYFYSDSLKSLATPPSAWDSFLNTGLGQNSVFTLWIATYLNLTSYLVYLGLDWLIIYSLFWVLPAFLISFISSYLLSIKLFNFNPFLAIVAGLIYSTNTYILMIIFGGQSGIMLGYSLLPFVYYSFYTLFKNINLRNSFIFGILLSLQAMFDIRMVYISTWILFIYFLLNIARKNLRSQLLFIFVIPLILLFLIHSYWIIPLVFQKGVSYSDVLFSSDSFIYLSFADISHTLSLLHPNWPENIFGKTYFMKFQYILLPIIAFIAFLARGHDMEKHRLLLYFGLVSIIGAFIAKGNNVPLGYINLFIFENIPGMDLFRDPTKWYITVAFGYSMLVPLGLSYISKKIKKDIRLVAAAFFIVWIALLFPIVNSFKSNGLIIKNYNQINEIFIKDKSYSRILWLPNRNNFSYFSDLHPSIGFDEINNLDKISIEGWFNNEIVSQKLEDLSIKYVVIPKDALNMNFTKNESRDIKREQKFLNNLDINLIYLKKYNLEGVILYELKEPKDHIYAKDGSSINWKKISQTSYEVDSINKSKNIIFSESYDNNWILSLDGRKFIPEKYNNQNLYRNIPPSKNIKITYEVQKYVDVGMLISVITIIISITYVFFESRIKYIFARK